MGTVPEVVSSSPKVGLGFRGDELRPVNRIHKPWFGTLSQKPAIKWVSDFV